jgi:hypothetical protein
LNKYFYSFFNFFVRIGLTGVQAQTSVNAIGGNAWGSGGSANYSIGQVFYQAIPEQILL